MKTSVTRSEAPAACAFAMATSVSVCAQASSKLLAICRVKYASRDAWAAVDEHTIYQDDGMHMFYLQHADWYGQSPY